MAPMKPEKLKENTGKLKKTTKKKDSGNEDTDNSDFNEGFLSIFDFGRSSSKSNKGKGETTEEDEADGADGLDGDAPEEEDYDDEGDEAVESPGGFLELIFGWIINPIAAIINGIINLVGFVIQLIGFIINFGDCWPYYFLYFGGILIYFPISIFFMVFGLSKVETKLFQARDSFHDLLMCLGLPVTGLHNSDEIREKCFFESGIKRQCPSSDMDFMKQLKNFNPFKDIFKLDFVSVLSLLTTFTLVSLIIYHVVKNYLWPFIKSLLAKKEEVPKKA